MEIEAEITYTTPKKKTDRERREGPLSNRHRTKDNSKTNQDKKERE